MITLFSPAKINLFLRILGRRPDGYHDLASLFQAVSLGDTITLATATHDTFTCSLQSLPFNESNLVIKALSLFRSTTGVSTPVKVHLEKRIPLGGGLGGGSSNAATMLWGLNALLNCGISDE